VDVLRPVETIDQQIGKKIAIITGAVADISATLQQWQTTGWLLQNI
jgi:hypothetical protein